MYEIKVQTKVLPLNWVKKQKQILSQNKVAIPMVILCQPNYLAIPNFGIPKV